MSDQLNDLRKQYNNLVAADKSLRDSATEVFQQIVAQTIGTHQWVRSFKQYNTYAFECKQCDTDFENFLREGYACRGKKSDARS